MSSRHKGVTRKLFIITLKSGGRLPLVNCFCMMIVSEGGVHLRGCANMFWKILYTLLAVALLCISDIFACSSRFLFWCSYLMETHISLSDLFFYSLPAHALDLYGIFYFKIFSSITKYYPPTYVIFNDSLHMDINRIDWNILSNSKNKTLD